MDDGLCHTLASWGRREREDKEVASCQTRARMTGLVSSSLLLPSIHPSIHELRPMEAHHFNPLSIVSRAQSNHVSSCCPPCLDWPPLGCVLGTAGVSWQSVASLIGTPLVSLACPSQPWNRRDPSLSVFFHLCSSFQSPMWTSLLV